MLCKESQGSDEMFEFSKTVNVTNLKNVLCQIPKAVVLDWGLKVGDELELVYEDGKVTIRPYVQRGSGLTGCRDEVARTTEA